MSTVQDVIFSDGSVLHDDGWVTTADGLLLFWVPPEHRLGLFWPRTLTVMGLNRLDSTCSALFMAHNGRSVERGIAESMMQTNVVFLHDL